MTRDEFAKVLAAALEIAQAHVIRVETERYLTRTVIYTMDTDQVLWRIEVEDPR